MTPDRIDLQRIRVFGGSQNHAFEELCSQLAALEPRSDGDVFFRKGVGADAGVECFIRHRNRDETGWQAKFFFEFGSGQVGQLDESIEQALAKHPRLKRYIVCIPFDLFDQRSGKAMSQLARWEAWVNKWKTKAAGNKRRISIELWSKSAIVERLGRDNPLYSGRSVFWFDDTFLTTRWFAERFERARASLGQRYTPDTNVELPIRHAILGFCRDPSVLDEVDRWGQELETTRHSAIRDLRSLQSISALAVETADLEKTTASLSSLLSAIPADPDYHFPIQSLIDGANEALTAAARIMRAAWNFKSTDTKEQDKVRYLSHSLNKLDAAIDTILSALGGDRWRIINERRVLVTGPAGIGKSHLFGDAVDHQVSQGRPAVLVLGGALIEDDLWSQIVKLLGLTVSPEMFLGAMDAAAEAAGTRAVIFIDAINERHGIAIWSERLLAFLKVIEPFPRVAVALSCRSTYLPYILLNDAAKNVPQLRHIGFSGRAAEAARLYLDRRGIVRMAAPNLVPEFENPLFLKTCCDYLQKEGLTELPRGLRGVTEIFHFYTKAVAKSVEHRLGLDHKMKIVTRALEALAAAFDKGERGYLEYQKAAQVLEPILSSEGRFETSLLAQLINEGVLADEPVAAEDGGIDQIVRFSFERYSDYRIARQLLDQHLNDISPTSSFKDETPLHAYLTGEDAYKHAGVIEAMAVQLPERCGLELPDAIARNARYVHLVTEAFLGSVLWREQKAFTKRTLELLKDASRMSGRDEQLRTLIAIATEPHNAFNANYLHDILRKRPMPDRDKEWSTYIAFEEDEDDPIETLISWTGHNGFEAIDDARAELTAIILTWCFTTSNRFIRDRATKSLATLLSTRLKIAAQTIDRFRDIDDLYVIDRLMASAYGAALQGMDVGGLAALAQSAFTCVFDRDEAIVHVLIRDYARGIIELAQMRGVLPLTIDIGRARPPYRSEWPIEDVPESTIESYKQDYPGGHRIRDDIVGSAVNDGDFARYISDYPIRSFSTLPIAWIGRTERSIYDDWVAALTAEDPKSFKLLNDVIAACDLWRAEQDPRSPMEIAIKFVKPGDPVDEDRRNSHEKAVDEAEEKLRASLGVTGWTQYCDQARHHVRDGLQWARRHYQWPPSFDSHVGRRWICKRAHDFGWTQERFADFERNSSRGGDRHNHRIERIGKKYQWMAFHELLARLADNVAYRESSYPARLTAFNGPWEVNRRDIDPSLLAARPQDEKRQSDRTWWMPVQVSLKEMSPYGRLAWLESPDDIVNGEHLITVTEPKTKRTWLVIDEFENWNQWGLRNGERTLDRQVWFHLRCVLVRSPDREKLVSALSDKIFRGQHDMPELDKPSEGYIGEYPWHPIFKQMDPWLSASKFKETSFKIQPTVTDYLAERGGHDYSIEETFRFNLPAPGLLNGMKLHLSNGRSLDYADDNRNTIFFDPSTREPGPGAGLIDRDAFLAYLSSANLEAVWIISGEKDITGGDKHHPGFGGSRSFTSIYWLNEGRFERRDFEERQRPTPEQLEKYFEEDGVEPPRPRRKPSVTKKPVRNPNAKPRAGSATKSKVSPKKATKRPTLAAAGKTVVKKKVAKKAKESSNLKRVPGKVQARKSATKVEPRGRRK